MPSCDLWKDSALAGHVSEWPTSSWLCGSFLCSPQLLSESQVNMARLVSSVSDILDTLQKDRSIIRPRLKADLQKAPSRSARPKGCANGERATSFLGRISREDRTTVYLNFHAVCQSTRAGIPKHSEAAGISLSFHYWRQGFPTACRNTGRKMLVVPSYTDVAFRLSGSDISVSLGHYAIRAKLYGFTLRRRLLGRQRVTSAHWWWHQSAGFQAALQSLMGTFGIWEEMVSTKMAASGGGAKL